MSEIVKADPTKDFFIHMLTKDILLHDCILDLADNCIDGANRELARLAVDEPKRPEPDEESRYRHFKINIQATPESFSIEDNCGGISIELAKNRVFYFGRPKSGDGDKINSIGLYGIGMKRALFKMGTRAVISSSDTKAAFRVTIDVPVWADKKRWEFDLFRIKRFQPPGTKIVVETLTKEAADHFLDQPYLGLVRKVIARDYAFFLQKGMAISLNGKKVEPHLYQLRQGTNVEPMHSAYEDDGVSVTISAGLASLPPDDSSPDEKLTEVDYFGWFVVCNDRVVLAADKSTKTVWGDDSFAVWHPQYNGFMGIVTFSSTDPGKLPWATTKRDVDQLNAVYRRAVSQMKVVTRQYVQYSNTRKTALKQAKLAESESKAVDVRKLKASPTMKLPTIVSDSSYVTVSYQARKEEIKLAARLLGSPGMAATKVGSKTLEYYLEHES